MKTSNPEMLSRRGAMSDFQFFSFPARIGAVKICRRSRRARRLSMRLKALRVLNRRQVRRVRQVILRLGQERCPLVPLRE